MIEVGYRVAHSIPKNQGEDHQGDDFTGERTSCGINRVLGKEVKNVLYPDFVGYCCSIGLDFDNRSIAAECTEVGRYAGTRLEQISHEDCQQNCNST